MELSHTLRTFYDPVPTAKQRHRHTHVGPTPEQLREMRTQAAGGASVADAARWIGVPRGTVGYWAKKYGVQFGRKP